MKCVIPGINIKTFGRIIHTLAKIGTEISLEPTYDGLELKALDDAKSAYVCLVLKPRFFQHYDDGSPYAEREAPRYRLAAKACLQIFKSLTTLEKIAERCDIKLNDDKSRVVFVLFCKQGVKKTYNLTYMEGEPIRARMSKFNLKNSFTADAKFLSEIVEGFSSNVDEIDFVAHSDHLVVRNTANDDEDGTELKNVMNTAMKLNQDDFEGFSIQDETTVCVCSKELKAAISFASFLSMSSRFNFHNPGDPVVITLDTDPTFTATYILATSPESNSHIADPPVTSHSQTSVNSASQQTTNTTNSTQRIANTSNQNSGYEPNPPATSVAMHRKTNKPSVNPVKRKFDLPVDGPDHSTIDVKPRTTSILNDTSISLLPAKTPTTSRRSPRDNRDELDRLLEEIDNDSRIEQPQKKMRHILPRGQTHSAVAEPDEVLAEDSEED